MIKNNNEKNSGYKQNKRIFKNFVRYDNTPYSESKVPQAIKLRINDEKLDLSTEKVLPNLAHYS